MLVGIFHFAWKVFGKYLKRQIFQAKHLISLFTVENLLENPYIMNFINEEILKGKLAK